MEPIDKQIKYSSETEVTSLLWTGGYDSTFRLLQLLCIEKKKVQPIYIIELSYKSPVHELMAMNEIRNMLECKGISKDQLRPTIYIDKIGIEINNEILKAWTNIKKRRHLGRQYIWIASLCKQYNLYDVELSIEKDSENASSESIACDLTGNRIAPDIKTIFKYFSLPLVDTTRQDMQGVIEKENWLHIMEQTWFCHHPMYHPFKKGIPCGICNPCRVTIEEGYGHRVPLLLRYSGKYLKKIYNSSLMSFIR